MPTPPPLPDLSQPSPTGKPIIPPRAVPWLMLAMGIGGGLVATLPEHTTGYKVALGVTIGLGPLLAMASPGLRRRRR